MLPHHFREDVSDVPHRGDHDDEEPCRIRIEELHLQESDAGRRNVHSNASDESEDRIFLIGEEREDDEGDHRKFQGVAEILLGYRLLELLDLLFE